jgi:hypothetical protein
MDRIAELVEALPPCPTKDKLRAMMVASRYRAGIVTPAMLQRMFSIVREWREHDPRTQLEVALEHAVTDARGPAATSEATEDTTRSVR